MVRLRRLVDPGGGRVQWMAVLFIAGAICFAVGSFPAIAQNVDPGAVGLVFFVGSIFFTAAATLQFAGEVAADRGWERVGLSWLGHAGSWWASIVQLAGTLLFNISTFDALHDGVSTEQTNRLVWAPDVFGSIAFLIAGSLAWWEVCGGFWCVHRHDIEWTMAAWNGLGSLLFMVSAIASLTLPTTGEILNLTLVNAGTFGGAVCFLAGSWLLLPDQS